MRGAGGGVTATGSVAGFAVTAAGAGLGAGAGAGAAPAGAAVMAMVTAAHRPISVRGIRDE
ncbi:hypothetical protein AXK57_00095 [Tsukamurella pulmonis]|nr:hypothetical protein AXK57_00095 [Tsukamurella pulmonis]